MLPDNVRYAAPREAGSHADRWTALALALQAADKAPMGGTIVCLRGRIRRREEIIRV